MTIDWLLDVPAQRVFIDDGLGNVDEVQPSRRSWEFIGFDVGYNAVTGRVEIRVGSPGFSWLGAVRAASTSPLPANSRVGNTLTADANGALPAQDGVALAVDNRFLAKDEVLGADNGIYIIDDLGSASAPWIMTRDPLLDQTSEVTSGATCYVSEGAMNGKRDARITNANPITINSTSLDWELSTRAGGVDIAKRTPISVVASPYAALGTDATIGCATTSGAIAVNLPDVATVPIGIRYVIIDDDGDANINNVTVAAFGGQLIAGGNPFTIMVPYGALQIENNGANWGIIR